MVAGKPGAFTSPLPSDQVVANGLCPSRHAMAPSGASLDSSPAPTLFPLGLEMVPVAPNTTLSVGFLALGLGLYTVVSLNSLTSPGFSRLSASCWIQPHPLNTEEEEQCQRPTWELHVRPTR